MDSITRFSARVENYVRYRPGYPSELVDLLAAECGLTAQFTVADIGSGTGLLARAFLDAGYRVIGVEPNAPMRAAGDAALAGFGDRFRSVNGRAEDTGLPSGSIDLIVAGQAFHWFDVPATRREWLRILATRGTHLDHVALIWNERFTGTDFMRAIEELIAKYADELDPDGSIREAGRGRIADLFAPGEFRLAAFPNEQRLDLAGLLGRIASCSYLPAEGHARYREMTADLERVFRNFQTEGEVRFTYRTVVYSGKLAVTAE